MTSRRGGWAGLVAAALCVPTTAGVVLLTVRSSAASDRNSAREGALGAAAHIARDILSYDYRTIDQDLARARGETTGSFARQYAAAAAQLRTQAAATHAIVQARVRDTGIVSAGGGHVVVLVFADQISVTRAKAAAVPVTRLIPSAVEMTLTDTGGRWRVAGLSAVQTGAPGSAAR
jgi:Mce-associated membrane protein